MTAATFDVLSCYLAFSGKVENSPYAFYPSDLIHVNNGLCVSVASGRMRKLIC